MFKDKFDPNKKPNIFANNERSISPGAQYDDIFDKSAQRIDESY